MIWRKASVSYWERYLNKFYFNIPNYYIPSDKLLFLGYSVDTWEVLNIYKDLLIFQGKYFSLFDFDDVETAYSNMDFNTIKDFCGVFKNSDGSVKHWLFVWDDGERALWQCKKCGAYFIHQCSEYHGAEDSYYSDWYQVENETKAIMINEELNG